MEKKKMIVVTEKGIVSNIKSKTEILAMLLFAYLDLWCDEMHEIDIEKASKRVIDALNDLAVEEETKDEEDVDMKAIYDILFGDDEENEEK